MYAWLYRTIQFSLRNMFCISLSCLLQSFPSPSLKDLHLPVSGSATLALYLWYVQTCQDSCVFLYFFPLLWTIICPLLLRNTWTGDLFANSIPENIRFKLLMVIVKSFARFDMVWKGWDAWTSLVWCFFFGLKVKRLTSLVFIHSDHTANMGMIDAWWKENTIDLFFKWRDHRSKCRIWHCSHERWYRSS